MIKRISPCPRTALLTIALLMVSYSAGATDKDMHSELRESHRSLMNMLAPEPTVNKGSDDVLSQLSAETTTTVKAGATVYHSHCAHCHGAALQGQPNWNQPDANGMLPAPPHDDSGHTWHHADDQLFEFVKYGPATAMGDPQYQSMMPAFQNVLSDSEIDAVLVFIRSTWSSELKEWQRGANDAQTGNVWWKKE